MMRISSAGSASSSPTSDLLRKARLGLGAVHPALSSDGFWQLVRFALGGLSVTLFAAALYATAAALLRIPPLAANTVSSLCAVVASYTVHSRWSFAADTSAGEGGMIARFLIVSAGAYALNSFWVWLLTTFLALPPLSPIPLMIFVTPFVSFFLNRLWVFKVA